MHVAASPRARSRSRELKLLPNALFDASLEEKLEVNAGEESVIWKSLGCIESRGNEGESNTDI